MFKYRGIEVTREIIHADSGNPNRTSCYRATVGGQEFGGVPSQTIVGSSEEEICDSIDEVMGTEDSEAHS